MGAQGLSLRPPCIGGTGGDPSFPLPFTLGHENAGWVGELGPGTTGFASGDPVIVYGPWGCGLRMNCRVGKENYCETPGNEELAGWGRNGGMANYLVVPSTRFLLPLGTLDPREAAPLSDAALTSYHAVNGPSTCSGRIDRRRDRCRRPRPDGHPGAEERSAGPTTVVALDTRPTSSRSAKNMGADEAMVSGGDAVRRIKDITRGQGAELVLDMVGVNPTLRWPLRSPGCSGHLTIVSVSGGQPCP